MKKLLKHGMLVLPVALLVMATLLTGCFEPLNPVGLKIDDYTPPAGMGAVRFLVSDGEARTIKPTTTVTDFQSFQFTFALGSTPGTAVLPGTAGVVNINGGISSLATTPIPLAPGSYTVEVIAYMGATQTLEAAKTAAAVPVVITAGTTASTSIALLAYAVDPGSGSGTFGWNITTGAGLTLTAATMRIAPLNGGTNTYDASPVNILSNLVSSTPLTLTSDYYEVTFNLNNGTSAIAFKQILQVYKNLPSTFTFEFLPAHFVGGVASVTVTFNYQDGTTTAITRTVTAGDSLGAAMPTDPTWTGYTFAGWWTADGTGDVWGTQFTASTTVSASIPVYAKWLEDGGLNGNGFTFTLGDTNIVFATDVAAVDGVITIDAGDSLTLSITNASAYSSITWTRANGVILGTTGTLTFDDTGTADVDTTNADSYLIYINAGNVESGYITVIVE